MIYLLDANTLIEAKNRYYSMTICPGYWAWILQSHGAGALASIAPVGDELRRGNDELASWAKQHQNLFWDVFDVDTQTAYAEVAAHVAGQSSLMKAGAVDEFLSGADPWLITKSMTTPTVCWSLTSSSTCNAKTNSSSPMCARTLGCAGRIRFRSWGRRVPALNCCQQHPKPVQLHPVDCTWS